MQQYGDNDGDDVIYETHNGFVKSVAPKEKLNVNFPGCTLPPHDPNCRCQIKVVTPEMVLAEVSHIRGYATNIASVVQNTIATEDGRGTIPLYSGLEKMFDAFKAAHQSGNKVILVGNGGSSAICSHIAIDFCKNVGIRAVSLNDFPSLTCLSNDFGYEHVFAKQVEYHAQIGDCLVCISTGGKSPNILNAIKAFGNKGYTFTFSGMKPDNELRKTGYINFYSPSNDYGIVEIAHMTLLHSLSPCTVETN